MKALGRLCAASVAMLAIARGASAQVPCTRGIDPTEPSGLEHDVATMLAMSDSTIGMPALFRRASAPDRIVRCGTGEPWDGWLREDAMSTLLPAGVELRNTRASVQAEYNTAYPRDRYNGALWAGRGASGAVSAGVELRWRWLSASFRPLITWAGNDEFRTLPVSMPGHSPFIRPFQNARIDQPQRFGESSIWSVDAGASWVRADFRAGAIGLSNENLWWGPSQRYPLILSNTAGGFPHLFAGTNGPASWFRGHWEVELLWGVLSESDFFDNDASNDRRLFSVAGLAWSPDFAAGLTLGAVRTYATALAPNRFEGIDYLVQPFMDVTSNRQGRFGEDQMLAGYLRWHLPASGFQAWLEWGRGDHWEDLADLAREPDHSQVYTVGASKLFERESGVFRLLAETTDLERDASPRSGRANPLFYTNGGVRQGHTHRGQLLGSPIGPGSNAQIVAVEWLTGRGLIGVELERVRYDATAYYAEWAETFGFHGHDLELTAALRAGHVAETWDVSARVGYSRRDNRGFVTLPDILLEDFDWRFPVDRNWSLDVRLGWRPSSLALPW